MTYVRHPDQPDIIDIRVVDGVFMKQMTYRHAEMVIPQHAHAYDHISFVAAGGVRVFADGRLLGEFSAPTPILIRARVKHRMVTLVPGTTILCIHNADRAEAGEDVVIHEEHRLEANDCGSCGTCSCARGE